ncbi:WxL domain-containing protein [Enterococcus faecalis]|uniref:WxL domain-containing protein n=6 Tax=Enterococcus faecalis TaxID=1351 RepID=UPI0019241B72|nr:WxL domain-containing protein [Enterococcus faecalis]EGO9015323.1 WxL domain-containing protein [Enterococcus faecalis]EJJ0947881.1 WxL domain-containing protein [Enterococcus faecalis]EKO5956759.1 WxL domain-containing protein [Enterococcus faecalis]EKR9260007.1 WxL domain-containing protein [Enterococcus faecalis]MDN3160342.1 WxL domain-containing protein [Enterococcus faecalis]
MKRNKWQRLAAIGLCGSLLVNAFSGVTAVAETVTIESSPTAESSVKEETQASSETQETTTETSREEVTKEIEKQAEVAVEKKEAPPVKAEQKEAEAQQEVQLTPQLPVQIQNRAIGVKAGNLASLDSQFRELSRNERNRTQLVTPEARLGLNLTSKDNTPLNTSDFKLKTEMGLTRWIQTTTTSGWFVHSDQTMVAPNIPTETGIDIILPSQTAVIGFVYRSDISLYYLKDPELTVPKYIDTVELKAPANGYTYRRYIGATGIGNPPNVGDYPMNVSLVKTNDTYVINQPKASVWPVSPAPPIGYQAEIRSSPAASTEDYNISASAFYVTQQDYALVVTHKKVTENFVDATGAKITPPTGFTQGQQTSITSNDFTYTSAKALPDTYKAGGKTYKFKGWYKGTDKTALKTTKTPSYAVTYDDQDDLTVMYEEIDVLEFPSRIYQFGFVDESGKRVDASTIDLTYDNWYGIGTEPPNNIPSAWATTKIETGIKANTNNNFKEITYPVHYLETNGKDAFQFSAANLRYHLPRFYKSISVQNQQGGFDAAYPYPTILNHPSGTEVTRTSQYFELKNNGGQEFVLNRTTAAAPENVQVPAYLRDISGNNSRQATYYTIQGPIYYYLTNRKVTENFVDASGAKITPPTGFTQGNKVVIDSENFTYTSAKALPDTYTVGDKNYKFKGWYKGTDQTKMKTTKTPSYAVTYDDKDDMTAVYEEVQEITVHPGFYAEFVDEQGQAFTNPLTLSGNYTEFFRKTATSPFEATGSLYPMVGSKEATVANRYKVETKQNVLIPNDYELFSDLPTGVLNKGFALNNFDITNELKYVDKVEATTKTITLYDYETISDIGTNLLSDSATTSFTSFETVFNRETNNTFSVKARWGQSGLTRDVLPSLLFLTSANSQPRLFGFDGTSDYKQTINYKVTRKQVAENFVDATGAKITPPTGFTQGKQTPMTSNSFTYTSGKALPATYTVGDKNYKFKGWYKGTDKTALKTTKTPSYAVTYDDKDDMTAVYEEVQATAEMTVSRLLEVVSNEASMIWTVRLKNTSEVPLTNVKLAPTAKWAAGISAPTQLAVRLGNTPNKIIPVTAEQWRTGVNLGVEIPVNGEALVTVNTAKITGEPRQLLTAEMTASGNFSAVTASNFVRIQGEDQTIEPTPAEEGFISMPTFDFGKIMISGSTKQYSLKKAADYYGNGTRNPYLRIKKSQPNWQLTAQLSQLKASADSLPTSTRLLLGNADVAAIENYNLVTELTNKVGVTEPLALTSDGTSTPVILNNQFTGNDVYQLEFDFASVKLEVPANQGKINEKYQGTVTWNLVTGP